MKLNNLGLIIFGIFVTVFIGISGSSDFGTAFAAKTNPEKDAAYENLLTAFETGKWEEALIQIQTFRSKHHETNYEASLTILEAECNLQLRRLSKANALAQRIIVQFPEVGLLDRARLVLGESALLTGNWEAAEFNLSWVVSFGQNSDIMAIARRRIDELHEYLTAEAKVTAVIDTVSTMRVALILPITGSLSLEADYFLTGFLSVWKKSTYPDPYIFDSENDPVKAVRLFQEAALDIQPWVVAGGLSSAEATGLAAYSRSTEIPFITTVCGNDGLASISALTIQGRADYGRVGAELGSFAALNMGLRELAILFVNTVEGRRLAREFRQSAEENGAVIMGEAGFFPGTIDFSNHLLDIKSSVIRHSFNDSLQAEYRTNGQLLLNDQIYNPTASEIEAGSAPGFGAEPNPTENRLSTAFLDSLWKSLSRTHRWTGTVVHESDSAAIELPELEGVFVAIEPGSIEMIAPQLARYRLNRQIFGDENWDNREALFKVQRYVNGLVFSNPLAPVNDSAMTCMASIASTQGDKSVTKYHFAGERAARMLIEAGIRSPSRKNFRDALATLNDIPTMSGKVTLIKEERVDRSPGIFLFKDGAFISLREK